MVTVNDPDSLLGEPLELPAEGTGRPYRPGGPGRRWSSRKFVIGFVVAVVLVGAGYALWHQLKNKPSSAGQSAPTASSQMDKKSASTGDTPANGELKTYKSDLLSLEISHPSDWTVTEKDGIRVTSPDFTYQTTDKGEVSGNFRVYIRRAARAVDGKYIGNGVATHPSEQLTYTNPGTSQRKTTNLTQFGSATSDHFTFVMITGDYNLKKDDTLGPNYGREPGTYILVGGYGTKAQTDDLDFSNVPLDHIDTKQAYTMGVNIIKSLNLK